MGRLTTCCYIIIFMVLASCGARHTTTIVRPVSATGVKIIRGFCTGYAIHTPEYGLIFKVSEIFCQDYDASMGRYLSDIIPGRLIIKDGQQFIHTTPEVLRSYWEELGSEGVLDLYSIEN